MKNDESYRDAVKRESFCRFECLCGCGVKAVALTVESEEMQIDRQTIKAAAIAVNQPGRC